MEMKLNRVFLSLLLLTLSFINGVCGEVFSVKITPHHKDWVYKLGEKVEFLVTITEENPSSRNFSIQYEIGPEKMPAVVNVSQKAKSGILRIDGGTLNSPGFLRCKVTVSSGDEIRTEIATAAFAP